MYFEFDSAQRIGVKGATERISFSKKKEFFSSKMCFKTTISLWDSKDRYSLKSSMRLFLKDKKIFKVIFYLKLKHIHCLLC